MSRQNVGRNGYPVAPPLAGLPIKMITIIVSSVPAAPTSFCKMAATNATTAVISEQIGHTIQNLLVEKPPSHRHTIRSTTRPATTANTRSPAARQRWAAFPVAESSRVELMYPPMSRGTIISPWTRPKGSLGGSGTGAYFCTASFCPVLLAASWNRSARTAGARSLLDGTTISVLEVPEGTSAPQIVVWSMAFLAACSLG